MKVASPIWLLLLAACSIYIVGIKSEPVHEAPELNDAADLQLGSLFGFRPCVDESCSDPLPPRPEYPIDEGNIDEDYEPQYPDTESPDYQVEHCVSVHTSTMQEASIVSTRHPDVKAIKMKVIEDLIRYTSQFSILNDNCDPAMKLLEYIILAAEALKHEYEKYAKACNFNETSGDGKSGEYPGEEHGGIEPSTPKSMDYSSTSPSYSSTEASKEPCPVSTEEPSVIYPEVVVSEEPCPEKPTEEAPCAEEVIAEEYHDSLPPPFVGSMRGIPGVHYPNYTDVPITTFSCADKKYVPGFYADLETGCQVFHVCYEHRRESFLCPIGTIFNQPILACDYWYSSNCSLAESYYEVNTKTEEAVKEENVDVAVEELIDVLVESKETIEETSHEDKSQKVDIMQFLPVKAKVVEFSKPVISEQGTVTAAPEQKDVEEVASQIFHKMVSTATQVVSKTREVVEKIPEPSQPKYELKSEIKLPSGLESKVELAAAPIAKAAIPIVKAKKLAAIKAALPLAAKVSAVPIAKVAVMKSVPVFAKAKLAAAVPAAKIAAVKTAVPIAVKAKLAAAVPAAKMAAVPIAAAAKLAVPAKVAVKAAAAKLAVPAKVAVKAAVPVVAAAKLAVPAKFAIKTAIPVAAKTAKVTVLKSAVPVVAKAKKTIAIPAMKVAAVKTAVPIAAKAKVAATIPVVTKAKIAAAIPKVAVKASVPLKSKMIASAFPLAKAKIAAPAAKVALKTAAVPVAKAKIVALPLVKANIAVSAPIVKAKLAKAAAISPLTKKALALGYMKLLKAKKLALMG